ncbi:MAG: hypothetical protein ACRCUJ_05930, partial [Phocaeicola sp.]
GREHSVEVDGIFVDFVHYAIPCSSIYINIIARNWVIYKNFGEIKRARRPLFVFSNFCYHFIELSFPFL